MRCRTVAAVVSSCVLALATVAAQPATGHPAIGHSAIGHSPAAPQPRPAAATYPDWPTYHLSIYRGGNARTMPAVSGPLTVTHSLTLDGAVYASPLVIGGKTVLVTENNTVYVYDSAFHLVWSRHLGPPSPAAERPCGNIDPLGITGTPVYVASTGLIYLAVEYSGNPPTHRIYGMTLSSGAIHLSHSLDLPGVDQRAMQQRGALTAVGSRVYVPFGGLAGDCGAYKGRVVGYALDGTGSAVSYTVPTSREAGIWTPPGPVADSAGNLFVAVGNGESGAANGLPYDYSDSVLHLSSTLARVDSFSPSTWRTDNDADLDLGSQGPELIGKFVFSAGKSGTAYVLNRAHLGGIGGQVSLCRSFGGVAADGYTVYVPCSDGVRAIKITSTGTIQLLWHAGTSITGSPVVGGGRIWSLDTSAGVLHALDPATGADRGSVSVGTVTRFATPAIYGPNLYIPTTTGLKVVTTS